MPQRVSRPFQARRALLRYLAPRYQQASPAQKTLLLVSFVEWTGYTREYAIELLKDGEYDQPTIQRRRLPQYRQEVQQALFLAWKATHYVCAKRLLPFLMALSQASGRRSCLCSRRTPSGPAPRSCRRSGARPLIPQSPHLWRRSIMVSAPSVRPCEPTGGKRREIELIGQISHDVMRTHQ
jgi:hypothetical protein